MHLAIKLDDSKILFLLQGSEQNDRMRLAECVDWCDNLHLYLHVSKLIN